MCETCMKLNKMNRHVIDFLSTYGDYPAIKKVDERILEAEERLANRLVKLQSGLESKFIEALRERGTFPTDLQSQRRFVSRILEKPLREMKTVIADDSIISAEIGRQMTFDDLVELGLKITLTEFSDKVKEEIWQRTYQFSEDTFLRIEGDFIKTLKDGYESGEGIDSVARELRKDFSNLRDYRLKTIARTEVQPAQNEGSHKTMREYNVRYKQWITVGDSRVRGRNAHDRYDHVKLHGQVVEFDEKFSNGMSYPTDRSGDIGDWINCRCRERPYLPKKGEVILTTPYYPSP